MRLQIAWHENRSSVLSVHQKQTDLVLRLHRLFSDAPSPVIEALARYVLKGDRKSGVVVRQMVHLYFSTEQMAPERLQQRGKAYHLEEIYARIESKYFSSPLSLSIGWAPRYRIGKFRSMTFGTYDRHRSQIRIHPLLDDENVPLYFLEFIVYHEMLHAVCPSFVDKKGAVRCHTPKFRAMEREFAQFQEAKEWEKKSLQFFKKRKYGRP